MGWIRKHMSLLVVILVAASLRFIGLSYSPPALNWDEVSIGYNAYSILKTGRDEWGKLFPVSFKAFGEHKLPGMVYASIPGIAIFGLNDLGVRITPALIGVLTVYVFYLLVQKLLGARSALIAASLLAISPWHVHLTRAAFEANLALLFVVLGVYLFIRALEDPRFFFPSTLAALVSVYSYNNARVVVPLLFVVYGLIWRLYRRVGDRFVVAALMLAVFSLIPIVSLSLSRESMVRWGVVGITSEEGFYDRIAESRYFTHLPGALPRLIHNKVSHYVGQFSLNYLNTFSTEFLFFSGDAHTERSTQGMGLLYLFEFPLLVYGLYLLIKRKGVLSKILIPWILLAPIPSALTSDAPSALRGFLLLPPLLIVESLGALNIIDWFRQKRVSLILRTAIGVFVVWNVSFFLYRLFSVYPHKYSADWLYGYKEAIREAMTRYDSFDRIYFTDKYGEPYIYFLFYGQMDPARFQGEGNSDKTLDPTGWVHVRSFDKLKFVDAYPATDIHNLENNQKEEKILLIDVSGSLPGELPRTIVIKDKVGKVMFEGVELIVP